MLTKRFTVIRGDNDERITEQVPPVKLRHQLTD